MSPLFIVPVILPEPTTKAPIVNLQLTSITINATIIQTITVTILDFFLSFTVNNCGLLLKTFSIIVYIIYGTTILITDSKNMCISGVIGIIYTYNVVINL